MKTTTVRNIVLQLDTKGEQPLSEVLEAIDAINEVLQERFPDMQPQIMASGTDASDLVTESPLDKVYEEMGRNLSEDESEYDNIIVALKEALKTNPDGMLDLLEYNSEKNGLTELAVWQPMEGRYTIASFCKEIGIDIHLEMVKAILERKEAGQDCTEAESAELKQYVKWNWGGSAEEEVEQILKAIETNFPVEYSEAIEELTSKGL